MDSFAKETLLTLLRALGDELRQTQVETSLVVVGGAALVLQGFVTRATQDVDVIALWEDGKPVLPRPLPPVLLDAVSRVAEAYQIDPTWVNAQVAKDWEHRWPNGLPPGLEDAEWHRFGSLRIAVASRQTLVALKLDAVLDRGTQPVFNPSGEVVSGSVVLAGYDRRHLGDLRALAPTKQELTDASAWVQTQDAGDIRVLLDAIVREVLDGRL